MNLLRDTTTRVTNVRFPGAGDIPLPQLVRSRLGVRSQPNLSDSLQFNSNSARVMFYPEMCECDLIHDAGSKNGLLVVNKNLDVRA